MKKTSSTQTSDLSDVDKLTIQRDAIREKNLNLIGDIIAKRESYRFASGIEAVYVFLINKHHWTPSQVRSMSLEDLELCVGEERDTSSPPPANRSVSNSS